MDDPAAPATFGLDFDSIDEGEIEDRVATAFPGMRMVVEGRPADGRGRLRQQVAGDERLVVQRFRLTLRVRADGDLGDSVVVGVKRGGSLAIPVGSASIDTSRPFVHPTGGFTGTADQEDLELLSLDRRALDRAVRTILGDGARTPPLGGSTPVSAAAEQYWRSVHRHIAGTLRDPLLRESPLIRDELFRSAVRALLLVFPGPASALGADDVPAAPQRDVDAATAYIEANAHRPVGLEDIVAASGAPARPLIRAFRQRHGITPMQHLREVRFGRVHQDLAEADPWSGATVAEVVRRWGFAPSGRFAGEYRQRFGERPSTTLRR